MLSVCLSVTLVDCDHISWNSSKIISPLVSLGCSLSADPNIRVYSKGNIRKFWPKLIHPPVDLSVGDIRSLIAAEWLHLQLAQRSQWRAYRKLPSLFLMVPSLTSICLAKVGAILQHAISHQEPRISFLRVQGICWCQTWSYCVLFGGI